MLESISGIIFLNSLSNIMLINKLDHCINAYQISMKISKESCLSPPPLRKQYTKLISGLKDYFLAQIILGNKTIRQASKNLKISDSSAKVIVSEKKNLCQRRIGSGKKGLWLLIG